MLLYTRESHRGDREHVHQVLMRRRAWYQDHDALRRKHGNDRPSQVVTSGEKQRFRAPSARS